jgi:hypothetical protein
LTWKERRKSNGYVKVFSKILTKRAIGKTYAMTGGYLKRY